MTILIHQTLLSIGKYIDFLTIPPSLISNIYITTNLFRLKIMLILIEATFTLHMMTWQKQF